MRLSVVTTALFAALCASSCAEQPCENDLSCEGKEQVCNPTSRRCENRPSQTPPACGGDGDCKDGRSCVNSVCRFAPPCVNLAGPWEVWVGDPGSGGTLGGTKAATQTACALSVVVSADRTLAATVDRVGSLTSATITTGTGTSACTASWSGDDTMRFVCSSAAQTFNLYARPTSSDGLAPVPCGGSCATCSPNAIAVPVCAP